MPYAKRMFKRYRKNLRNNRALSTRRIFSNKSAKSQAKQIYALRRSINSVRKQCLPEIKICRSNVNNFPMAFERSGYVGITNNRFDSPFPDVGTTDSTRIGNKIKLIGSKLFIGLQYEEFKNSSMSYYDSTMRNNGIQLRLIAVQAKVAHSQKPVIDDILQNVNFSSMINSMMMMREPFQIGITSRFDILCDKHFTVSKDSPTKSMRINIKPAQKSVIWEEGQTYPKGAIYYFILEGGADFNRFESGEDYVYDWNTVSFTYRCETVFSDA